MWSVFNVFDIDMENNLQIRSLISWGIYQFRFLLRPELFYVASVIIIDNNLEKDVFHWHQY